MITPISQQRGHAPWKSGGPAEEETLQFPAPPHTHGTHSLPSHTRHLRTLEEAVGSPPPPGGMGKTLNNVVMTMRL